MVELVKRFLVSADEMEEKAKGVTIGERLREKEADYVPEPGAYEIKTTIQEGP